MNFLKSLAAWSIAITSGVVQAEQTASAEAPGTSKLKTASDIAVTEAQTMGQVLNPSWQPVIAGGATALVSIFNLIGLFQHKKVQPPQEPMAGG